MPCSKDGNKKSLQIAGCFKRYNTASCIIHEKISSTRLERVTPLDKGSDLARANSTIQALGRDVENHRFCERQFIEHFRRLAPRLLGATGALGHLLPNLGGPSVACRRLYMGVVRSMGLYGAPVWAPELRREAVALLRKPQRVIAIRAIRGYRTISAEAVCVLACSQPWDLEAVALAKLHKRRQTLRSRGESPTVTESMNNW